METRNFSFNPSSINMTRARQRRHSGNSMSQLSSDANVSESELVHKAQAGDRAAFGQLILAYQDRLYNAMVRMVGNRDEARDLTQEAFTRGLEKIDSFRGDASAYSWLFRIGMNLAISQLRKVQQHRVFSLDRPVMTSVQSQGDTSQASSLVGQIQHPTQQTPAQQVLDTETHAQVLAALGRLDSEYRAILVMRDIEGMAYQEMADVLNMPLGTLKSRLFRARLALREELKHYL